MAYRRAPLIIEVRVNEWARREKNPQVPMPYSHHVPYTPEEIAAEAEACVRAGASMIHYHARGPRGERIMEPAPYRKAIRLIKQRTNALVMPTLGMDTLPARERMRNLIEMHEAGDVMPELAPIDVITCNMDLYDARTKTFTDFSTGGDGSELFQNTPLTWTTMATQIAELRMKPVPILWDIGSVRNTEALVDMKLLRPPLFCEIALTEGGLLCGHPGTLKGLRAHLDFFPAGQDWQWTVLLWGASLLPLADDVIRLGGHISIGLGDYGYPELGFPSNAKLVERVAAIADRLGRSVATPDEARALLGIS